MSFWFNINISIEYWKIDIIGTRILLGHRQFTGLNTSELNHLLFNLWLNIGGKWEGGIGKYKVNVLGRWEIIIVIMSGKGILTKLFTLLGMFGKGK